MNMPTLVGYILIQTESQSVQGVNSYDILFAGMSNVWKRYFFANQVTYNECTIIKGRVGARVWGVLHGWATPHKKL